MQNQEDLQETSVNAGELQAQMKEQEERALAMTRIVGQLKSDDSIEDIMAAVVMQIGSYLVASGGFIAKCHRNDNLIDVNAIWVSEDTTPVFSKGDNQERPWFLYSEHGVTVDDASELSAGEREELQTFHIRSLAAIPIRISGAIGFWVCFYECDRNRIWSDDDIKFLVDSVRILESIIFRRIQKNSLASSFASLESILDNVGSAIYVRDYENDCMLFINRTMRNDFTKELKAGAMRQLFEVNIPTKAHSGNYEVYHEARDRWYDVYYTNISWVDGRKACLCALYDITEKKLYQKKIEQQAYTDFLTGLYNRMCCERDLARFIDEAKNAGQKGFVFYLDLDDFKHINDGLGHQYGDILLKNISEALQAIEGIHTTCYRMGGDEFVIIVPKESYDMADHIVEQIKKLFARPWYLKDADYYCTMSMGSVEFPSEGDSVTELIKKADIAMYEAKKAGKNRIATYSDNIETTSSKRLDMEKNMRDATNNAMNQFEVYYQPIVENIEKGHPCVGCEALVRWNSKLGFITPSEFIPLAEYLGLIAPIGNYVLSEACKACKHWNDNGYPDYHVNVNLSVVQLLQPDIVEIVKKALDDSGLRPEHLFLEITESLAINDLDRTKEILMKIKRLGVKFALDDFGTGYSSLNNIRSLPFDVIKVDQNFVKDLAEDAYSQAFIRMIAELGEAIGADICVEGIETEYQLNVLNGMKVRYIQGFYYDRPMKREAFEKKYAYNAM